MDAFTFRSQRIKIGSMLIALTILVGLPAIDCTFGRLWSFEISWEMALHCDSACIIVLSRIPSGWHRRSKARAVRVSSSVNFSMRPRRAPVDDYSARSARVRADVGEQYDWLTGRRRAHASDSRRNVGRYIDAVERAEMDPRTRRARHTAEVTYQQRWREFADPTAGPRHSADDYLWSARGGRRCAIRESDARPCFVAASR